MYKGHCLFNIPHCKTYQGGIKCSQCENEFELKNEICVKIEKQVEVIKQTEKKENEIQLPSFILSRTSGFERVKEESVDQNKAAESFLSVLKSSNKSILDSAEMMALFQRLVRLKSEFKAYFKNNSRVYEGEGTYDWRRGKTFISGFRAIGFV